MDLETDSAIPRTSLTMAVAERLRDQWCAEYTKARDALRAIRNIISETLDDD